MRLNCMSTKLHVKSASFSTDNGQTSRFSFSYRISYDENFIPKYFDNALTLHEHRGDRSREKSSCERFCKVPNAEKYRWSKIGNGVISSLWQLRCHWTLVMKNFHLNTTVVAIFPNVRFFCDLVYAQTWYWPWRLTVSSHLHMPLRPMLL